MATLSLKKVEKDYAKVKVIHGVDLEIEAGEFIVFVGPSGCGKSTLLRMIAGLEDISGGTISIDGEEVNDVTASQRGVAMVFQSYALYPHMSVRKNMAFSLSLAKMPKAEIDKKIQDAADSLQITPYLDRLPKQLSGGQRQRVAIGRAIVRDPKVFLFDEPLSNLDAALRVQTRIEITRLHQTMKTTMIYVTHDQVEAMTLADRIVVLNDGRIEQVGSPLDLYNHPINTFVAGFIGSPKMNLLPAQAETQNGEVQLSMPGNTLVLPKAWDGGQNAVFGIRPEHLRQAQPGEQALHGRLELAEQLGEHTLAYLRLEDGTQITAKLMGQAKLAADTDIALGFNTDDAHIFAA
jgi:ABC-type sugar transport system ATPase subunit